MISPAARLLLQKHTPAEIAERCVAAEAELKEIKYKIVVLPNGEMVSIVWLKRHLLGPDKQGGDDEAG